MKCSKHDYEYGWGSCPRCEQERHNRVLESNSERHIEISRQASEAQQSLLQQIRYEAELREQQAIQREAAHRERESQRIARKEILNFLTEASERYEPDFFSRFYMRIVLYSGELTGGSEVLEFIDEHLLEKMSEPAKKFISLQQEYIQKLSEKRMELELVIESNIEKVIKSNSDSGDMRGVFAIVGAVLSFFIAGLVGAIIGGVVGYLVGCGSYPLEEIETFEMTERAKLDILDNSSDWFNSEYLESKKLYEKLMNSDRLAFRVFERWQSEESKGMLKLVKSELANLSKTYKKLVA